MADRGFVMASFLIVMISSLLVLLKAFIPAKTSPRFYKKKTSYFKAFDFPSFEKIEDKTSLSRLA